MKAINRVVETACALLVAGCFVLCFGALSVYARFVDRPNRG